MDEEGLTPEKEIAEEEETEIDEEEEDLNPKQKGNSMELPFCFIIINEHFCR
jgi:hypothetical protein